MKKILNVLIITVLAAAFLFTGCSGSNSNEIKIGVNYELTGEVATYGQASVAGIKLAVEEINAAGGINGKLIKLVEYDNKSDKAEAMSLSTKLMTRNKVVAVMGPATSGAFSSTIPEANNNKIPVASGSATADTVTVNNDGNVQEYAFRICFSDSYQGTAMGLYALKNLSKTKAIIIKDSSSDYAKGLAENFAKAFKDGCGEIVAEEALVSGDKDFNAIVTKIKGLDFDVIYLSGYYEEAGLIIKQAR
ncbi:MAG: ABC transporter substrate-binding protein, partial [Eubacteriales bacterium]|nr:ABC transporter substrate-binding protein [Eubacteriales bacterium]